ncbi:MAG: hypothetical protein WCK09_07890 [Bacteroidota bacterium]
MSPGFITPPFNSQLKLTAIKLFFANSQLKPTAINLMLNTRHLLQLASANCYGGGLAPLALASLTLDSYNKDN